MTLNELRDAAYANSSVKGFWEGVDIPSPQCIAEKLALIHSEVSEALEEARSGFGCDMKTRFEFGCDMKTRFENRPGYSLEPAKPCGFPSELADIIIRVADLAGKLGIDLDMEVWQKMQYNKTREHKHGKAF